MGRDGGKSEEDLIPVYLWLKSIEEDTVTEALIQEKQMDPAIYENEEAFQKQIVPALEAPIVARVGYEKAHAVILPKEVAAEGSEINTSEKAVAQSSEKADVLSEEDPGAFLDQSISLVDRAIQGKTKEYVMAKREITKREQSAENEAFLEAYVYDKGRKVIYNGEYTSTLIVEATVEEIEFYAKREEVEEISLYEDLEMQPASNITINQIGADHYLGTKSSSYNNGLGYKGTDITIGILESNKGRYDSDALQLKDRSTTRLQFVQNPDVSGSQVSDHATMITSLIVGKSVTMNGQTYEGIVPNATVIQMNVSGPYSVYTGIRELASRGVDIINRSGGQSLDGYSDYDKEVDRLIDSLDITFVVSTGNDVQNIKSPGKALNAITVGNAVTKNQSINSVRPPYSMADNSAYGELDYLPNKPDLAAPGTEIVVPVSDNQVSIGSGSSASAPLVTGVLAQMCQVSPSLRYSRERAKALLLLSAERDKISTTNNNTADNPFLRDKSGARLVNAKKAIQAVQTSTWEGGPIFSGRPYSGSSHYFRAGQKVRAVMVFGKNKENNQLITSSSTMDDIDVYLKSDKTGNTVASSVSSRNNVEIIEYTFTTSGYYHFYFKPVRVIKTNYSVPMCLAWRIVN